MSLGIRQHMTLETVAALAVRKPILVAPETPVRQVAASLRAKQLGCAFVVDAAGKPVGKFTQRQLLQLLVADSGKLDRPVAEVMYREVATVTADTPVADLLARMNQHQVRYLAVVDAQGRVTGLTGQKGLMEYIADHFPRYVKVQRMKPLISLNDTEGG